MVVFGKVIGDVDVPALRTAIVGARAAGLSAETIAEAERLADEAEGRPARSGGSALPGLVAAAKASDGKGGAPATSGDKRARLMSER